MTVVAARPPLRAVDWDAIPGDVTLPRDGLGVGWVDGAAAMPGVYEPVGVRDTAAGRAVVCTDPHTRPGDYDTSFPPEHHPPLGGRMHPGIGCAWRETGIAAPSCEVTWAGWVGPGSPVWVEAAPLIHVTPGTASHGIGVWVSSVWGQPAALLALIGAPPEEVVVLDAASIDHEVGTPRRLGIHSTGTHVTGWIDDAQIEWNGAGLDAVPIPAELHGSTRHGFALDAHLTLPALIPTAPAIHAWTISP